MNDPNHENFLLQKLAVKENSNSYRTLPDFEGMIDFCSNDYLGFSRRLIPFQSLDAGLPTGATGSRLISGNSQLAEETESMIAGFHNAESALIFNCGYMANVGLFSSVIDVRDVVIHDELIHASIIDGIRLSFGQRLKFKHNTIDDLERILAKTKGRVFVAIESVYSMDGDIAPLELIANICEKYGAHLIVDEAHAVGVFGSKGEGLVSALHLEKKVFARVITFGKAIGLHGAAVLGSNVLIKFLINHSRAFIYTTALPPHNYLMLQKAYLLLPDENRTSLFELITHFKNRAADIKQYQWQCNDSPIQNLMGDGNDMIKNIAERMQENKFAVKAILHPTVPKGRERLRICLHSFNTIRQIDDLFDCILTA